MLVSSTPTMTSPGYSLPLRLAGPVGESDLQHASIRHETWQTSRHHLMMITKSTETGCVTRSRERGVRGGGWRLPSRGVRGARG